MEVPGIKEGPGFILFNFPDSKINLAARRLKEHGDDINGELIVTTSLPSYNPHIKGAKFNFNSDRTRKEWSNSLMQVMPHVDWYNTLEALCQKVKELIRRGAPLEWLDPESEIKSPEFVLYPLLVKNETNLIYGEGGSGKSFIALLCAIICQSGWWDNPYDLVISKGRQHSCLYLDWESNRDIMAWRERGIVRGMALDNKIKIAYRRCFAPLRDDVEKIQELINDVKADLIIIDSAGMAAGGDLNKSETATDYFRAVRALGNITNLTISHTSKDQLTKKKTPFGSVYFWNEARSIWELAHNQDDDGHLSIGLFHKKANNSKLFHPIGFDIAILEDLVLIESQDVRSVADFVEHLSIMTQIAELLKNNDAMDSKAIAKELNQPFKAISQCLWRGKKSGNFSKIGEGWVLAGEGVPQQ